MPMDKEKKKQLGLYNKFRVIREDREDRPGYRHHECRYFVLDMSHDPHAIPALRAYAKSARADGYAVLADDLENGAVALERFIADEQAGRTGPESKLVP